MASNQTQETTPMADINGSSNRSKRKRRVNSLYPQKVELTPNKNKINKENNNSSSKKRKIIETNNDSASSSKKPKTNVKKRVVVEDNNNSASKKSSSKKPKTNVKKGVVDENNNNSASKNSSSKKLKTNVKKRVVENNDNSASKKSSSKKPKTNVKKGAVEDNNNSASKKSSSKKPKISVKKGAVFEKSKIENNNKSPASSKSSSRKPKTHVKKGVEAKQQELFWCHQCHTKKEKEVLIKCNKCQNKRYCLACIHKWYPGVSEDEFAKACPACCNYCNCKGCLRGSSPKDIQGYSCSEPDKIPYSKHILQNIFYLVKVLNEEQLMEKEIEAKVKGLSMSELQLQDAECAVDDDIFCDNCGAFFVDLYRSCTCGYDLCLVCSRELRDGRLQGGKGMACGWKSRIDGSIPCPPKDIGGCDSGTLELKRIMPVNWVANLLEKAQGRHRINKSSDIPQTSSATCFYPLNPNDIQPQDIRNFQLHWSKGEPIIVSDVLSSSPRLSWEPMVMWRAFRDVTISRNDSHASELKAINCLDWTEVSIDNHKFFKGYSESQLKQKSGSLYLKVEDWQPSCVSQGEWPRHFVEFVKYLPFKDYTHPNHAYLNVADKLPELSSKPDMGPRMDIGYGNCDTKLHYNKADTVSILTHTVIVEQEHDDQDAALVSEADVQANDNHQHVVDPTEGGALWDVFRRQDISKLEEFLRNHSSEFSSVEVVHPIHDRAFYLNVEHKWRLKEEFGVEPFTFKQRLGDAVFIPAGCPYQVRNLQSCTKVELDFISPESLGECIRLQNELRLLPESHKAKQQKLNIGKMMIYAVDHAVTELPSDIDASGPVNALPQEYAEVPEILNDMNVSNHTNGWVCDTESESSSQETSSLFPSLSQLTNLVVDHQPHESSGLWRGNAVGAEAIELLQAVETHYPNTFHGVHIRATPYWLSFLKGLHVFIKGFLETSVDALLEEQITSYREGLNDFERLGFDLSWIRKRLDMAEKLKFGNDPLRQELVVLEESLELHKEKLVEAHERLQKARFDHDIALDARNKKVQEMVQKFGDEYDHVLKGHLGFGILPGY